MKVGEQVRHLGRPEAGIGVIEEIFDDGHCTVKFEEATFSWVTLAAFISVEEEILAEQQRIELEIAEQEKRNRIHSSLWEALHSDFLTADRAAIELDPDELVNYPLIKVSWMKENFGSVFSEPDPNDEQLLAIGDFSESTLVKARAGSGKTTVIKHKISLLLTRLGVGSREILVLAFNKAAASKINSDMQQKTESRFFTSAKTFHSLAHGIVAPPRDSILFDSNTETRGPQTAFIEEILRKEDNPALRGDLYQFFRQEYSEIEKIGVLLSDEEFYTRRRNLDEETLGGEIVRSLGEKWIADFLFEHGVSYKYEQLWSWRWGSSENGEYQPDFTLYINGNNFADVVIEHFGIDEYDKSKKVPEHWSRSWDQYHDEMTRKREYWRTYNSGARAPVLFLETSVADMPRRSTRYEQRVAFEDHLYQLFQDHGFTLRKLPQADLEERIVKHRTPRFVSTCVRFIARAKKQRISPAQLQKLAASFEFKSEKERVFLNIVIRVYQRYQKELKERQKLDYDDLIERAINEINIKMGAITISGRDVEDVNLLEIKYLMIDEYQDFSLLFFNLVKAIRQFNPGLKIFCVGDDWQAINGFAGSDLRFFSNFEQMFDNASLAYLQNNYRSQSNLVGQANRFMAHTNGEPSLPRANRVRGEAHKIVYTNDIFVNTRNDVTFDDNPDACFLHYEKVDGVLVNQDRWGKPARLLKACFEIVNGHDLRATSFRILSRNNSLGYPYHNLKAFHRKLRSCFPREIAKDFDENVVCETIHRSKGAESDVVILLNILDGVFPANNPQNELFSILGVSREGVFAEEERLFYVGITRAKQTLYLVTEKNTESEFVGRLRETEKFPGGDQAWSERLF